MVTIEKFVKGLLTFVFLPYFRTYKSTTPYLDSFFLINFNIYINQKEVEALQSTSQIVLKTSGRLSLLKQKDLEDERESLVAA